MLADDGRLAAQQRVATPQGDYWGTVTAIVDLVAALESQAGFQCSIGVGIPGAVSPASGLVKNANSTCLIGRPFDRDLMEALERPIRLANDANSFALSEALEGAGQGAATVFGVILGTGVGGGLIVEGRPVIGCNAIGGEWGHNPLPWPRPDEHPGPACYCGKNGCIETFLSGPGLFHDWYRSAGSVAGNGPAGKIGDSRDVVRAASAGEPGATAAMRRYEDRLARALASVINIVDPAVIVLGGGLSEIESPYRNLPTMLSAYVFSDEVANEIRPPRHGGSSGARGAAWLWSLEESHRPESRLISYG